MDVLIIGGGIAGLTAALCLQHCGVEPQIAEQAPAFGEVGAGLQLGPNAVKVLRALDLEGPLLERAQMPEAIVLRSGYSKHEMLSLPLGEAAQNRWGAPYVHIHRADLVALLADAARARGIVCHFNKPLEHISQAKGHVALTWRDGTQEQVPFVLGADGLRSIVRQGLFDHWDAVFTGQIAWRALVERDELGRHAPRNASTIWTGRGCHAVTYWLRGGDLVNIVGVVEQSAEMSASWSQQGRREDALRNFKGFEPAILKILRKAPQLHRWGLFQHRPLKHWAVNGAALIGDACHAMPPFLAQGAAMAIEDAWVFAKVFSGNRSGEATLPAYQQQRQMRVEKVAKVSRDNGERYHMRSAIERLGALGALSTANAIAKAPMLQQLDWLYGYDVTKDA